MKLSFVPFVRWALTKRFMLEFFRYDTGINLIERMPVSDEDMIAFTKWLSKTWWNGEEDQSWLDDLFAEKTE